MESQNQVQWVYSSRNNEELAERYDHWARCGCSSLRNMD